MQIKIEATQIWVAVEPVDFRKAANGLREIVVQQFGRSLNDAVFVFFNRAKNAVKILGYHRNGTMLLHKRLDKRRFTIAENDDSLYALDHKTLSWLLAGLDWVQMSENGDLCYDDFY